MSYKSALQKLALIPEYQRKYNIFCYVNQKAVNSLKENVDLSTGETESLANLVCGIKDNIATNDMPTTCASEMLSDYVSPFDATCVKLLKDQGVVIAGKTNLDEFGMGSGGIHSKFGPTFNPLFPGIPTITGGSSSGSAAAVAAGVVDFALGTDTGGSVRLPAAYTSILGFKPSYGRISRFGVVAYAQSFDTVGILSKNIDIIKKVFKVLDVPDKNDPTSLDVKFRNQLISLKKKDTKNSSKKYKIGIPQEFIQTSIPDNVKVSLQKVVAKLIQKGHDIIPVSIPSVKYSLPIYYTLVPSEAVSNLSRYDGIRYGTRDKNSDIDGNTLFAPTRQNFGSAVKERIILGNYNLCSDSFKNNYIKAQKLRVQLIQEFDSIFKFSNILTQEPANCSPNADGVDFLLGLTAMNNPKSVIEFEKDIGNNNASDENSDMGNNVSVNEFINDVFTMPMSLAGLPTISIPAEKNKTIGVQLIGQYGDDEKVLDFAESLIEQ